MPRVPNLPCSNCGVLGWPVRNPGQTTPYTCRPCRRAGHGERKPYVRTKPYKNGFRTGQQAPCADCGTPAWGERCRACRDRAQVVRSSDDHRSQRWQRAKSAPGLNSTERSKLLAKWKRQGRSCTYCPRKSDTVDHVIPLVRGGTNHEGNLTPACRSCNARKCALLLSEWRHGRKPARMAAPLPWLDGMGRKVKAKGLRWAEPMALAICPGCNTMHDRPKWCGDYTCWSAWMRNQYRARVGIPEDAPLYSRAS